MRTHCVLLAFAFVGFGPPCFGQYHPYSQDFRVAGVVKDSTGAVIPAAEVILAAGNFRVSQHTNNNGQFLFEHVPAAAGHVSVRARGFAPGERDWSTGSLHTVNIELWLQPEPLAQQLTVTATRTEITAPETPAAIILIGQEELAATSAVMLDDILRQVAGFNLFRRTSSRTSNPTSQGVSLRGLGASGASRALVISDGIPLNDEFGGWVYWDRIPRLEIGRLEVLNGGASPLYGTEALGGVINVIRRPIDSPALSFEASGGNEHTPDASFFGSERIANWAGAIGLDAFHTHGYIPVPVGQRGTVDTFAASEHLAGDVTLERLLPNHGRIYVRGSGLGESRSNGTQLQINHTTLREVDLGGEWRSRVLGSFSAVSFAENEIFDQTFSAISLDRNTEKLTTVQRSPSQQTGIDSQWSRAVGNHQFLVAGVEARAVRGEGDNEIFLPLSTSAAGGRQRGIGAFFEDVIHLTSRWMLTPIARIDHWRNFAGFSSTQLLVPPERVTRTSLPEQTESFISPRLGTVYRITDNFSLTAAGYRSFRAPTLNELYRSFRVGNVVTQNNPHLSAERLAGGEGGVIYRGLRRRLTMRGTFFWSEITRPVANVTLSITPTLITQQRRNLGRSRARGVEFQASARVINALTFSGGYQFDDATITSFPSETQLVGLRLPQVPRHQFSLQALYSNSSLFTLGIQGRYVGVQFDNDLNTLPLKPYFAADAILSRELSHFLAVFVAGENLLNQRYQVGRTPVVTVGPPIMIRGGLHLQKSSQPTCRRRGIGGY